MIKYKSKIGLEIVLFFVVVLGSTSVMMILERLWFGLLINLSIAGFIFYVFNSTYYIINGNDLIIKCGFVINISIKIDSIIKIVETKNPLSSPATSLDRIAIYYKNNSVMISPKEKEEFIYHLLSINSKIEVIKKNKKNLFST